MNILLILAHPNKGSFNHAIAKMCVDTVTKKGHKAILHDLYEEKFDPILPFEEFAKDARLPADIQKHCDELKTADGIVFIHPNWWGQPPAILKGWIDRVVRAGVAYEFVAGDKGEGVPRGLLKIKTAVVFNTANTPMEREQAVFGDPLEAIWKKCVFGLTCIPNVLRKTFAVVITSTDAQRKAWLREAAELVDQSFPK